MLDTLFRNQKYRKNRSKILLVIDMIMIMFAYMFSYWTKVDFQFQVIKDIKFSYLIELFVFVLITYAVVFYIFKIYRSLWQFISTKEVIALSLANVVATLIIMIFTRTITTNLFYISVELIACVISILLMFSFRSCYRIYRRYTVATRKAEYPNVVIIGAGSAGNLLLREMLQNDSFEYNVVGFVDDARANLTVAGLPVLGTSNDLVEIKEKYDVELAIIAISNINKQNMRRIVECVQEAQLPVKIMSNTENIIKDSSELGERPSIQDVKIEDLLGRGEIKLDQKEIQEYIENKIVLVTGAGGSIGSELCRQIVKFKPNILVLLDINENGLYMLEQEFNRDKMHGTLEETMGIISIITSIRDKQALEDVFDKYKPDVVYHAAAHKHVPLMETRPMEAIKNNVFGTNNVIQTCIKHKVSRFIMISTDKAVNPTNVMGATKRMTEMILQANGNNGVTKMAAVRFGNVLGSNGSVIPIFKSQIKEGGPVTITDKGITRYFMTIPEASQLVLQAGYYANSGEIFVLDMGEPVKIIDLAEKLIRLSGLKPYEDIEIKEIGLRPGEKMYEELQLETETHETTKNELIFKNHVLPIEKEYVENILDELKETLDKEDVTNLEIREKILKVIK